MNNNKTLEEYLSFVRHELRNQIVIIREGISQVLEGLYNEDSNKRSNILKISLDGANELNNLINQFLTISQFKDKQFKTEDNVQLNKSDNLEEAKERFMRIISYKVRTSLSIVKEGLSLIEDEIPGKINVRQKKVIFVAKKNINRLIKSIEELLQTHWDQIIKSTDPKFLLEVKDRNYEKRKKK